jgi:CBS domain-containing protein
MVIAGVLKQKGGTLLTVQPHATIADVVQTLTTNRIGAVLVVSGDAENGAGTLDRTAADLMTSNVTTATPQTTVAAAMELMTSGRFRHVPVMEDGRLVGLVSIGDVVKAKIADAEQEVDSLRAYVVGG